MVLPFPSVRQMFLSEELWWQHVTVAVFSHEDVHTDAGPKRATPAGLASYCFGSVSLELSFGP